jgi:beta-1,4-mannosyl-glycoprotein beta-1,4-N-acetylglucosaminyltransferase
MIYDCFTLRDELEMLEIRLKILDPYVDKFVICEADKTHTNQPKEYNFHNNRKRFQQWEDKIIYVPIKLSDNGLDFDTKDTQYTPTSPAWIFENQQRNALSYGLKNIQDEDIIMIGDIDEIPNMKNVPPDEITTPRSLIQNFYYYYINNKSVGSNDSVWGGTVVLRGKHLTTPQEHRNNRWHYPHIMNGGWHLSYMGGKEMIRKKIQSIAHTEYNHPQYYSDENINKCLTEGTDIFSRPGMNFKIINLEDEYPLEILNILNQYPNNIYHAN